MQNVNFMTSFCQADELLQDLFETYLVRIFTEVINFSKLAN